MQLSIKARLIVVFTLLIALAGFIYYLGDTTASVLNSQINEIVENRVTRIVYTGTLAKDQQFAAARLREFIMADDPEIMQESLKQLDDVNKRIDISIESLMKLQSGKSLELSERNIELRGNLSKVEQKVRKIKAQNTPEAMIEAGKVVFDEYRPVIAEISKNLDKNITMNQEALAEAKDSTDVMYAEATRNMLITLIVSIIISLIIAAWIITSISKSLNEAKQAIKSVSEGDLTIQITNTSKDEIGELMEHLKSMVAKLKDIISSVTLASENIASASQQMSSSSLLERK
jgi:methyl-accepting chemotaxis protein